MRILLFLLAGHRIDSLWAVLAFLATRRRANHSDAIALNLWLGWPHSCCWFALWRGMLWQRGLAYAS